METLQKNQIYQADITGYSSEGSGIARIDGMVVFVPKAVAGETCDIRIVKVLKNCAYGRIEAILTPSPQRQESDCPHFGICGGCDFRHISYAEELILKAQRVRDALTRLGGAAVELEEIMGAEEILRYRNKSQYPVAADGTIGLYRARTHQVVEVESCLLQQEAADATAAAMRAALVPLDITGYDETTGKGLLRHIYVRTNRLGESLCCLLVNGRFLPDEIEVVARLRAAVPSLVGIVLGVNTSRGNVILGKKYRTLWGADHLMDTLCGFDFKLSVPSFHQVNSPQAERLYAKALEFAALEGTETVLDLYCGIGTITLALARQSARVIGAEIVPEAVADAEANARRNGVENVSFFCGDAGAVSEQLAAEGLRPDVVCVDPPRKGFLPGVAENIAAMEPKRIVYVSCDPATLSRDCAILKGLGYAVCRAVAVDLFPRCVHVETVVLLSKLKSNHHIEVNLNMDELDLTSAESKATYDEIKEYVLESSGLKVSSLYIGQVKDKMGIKERENFNISKKEDAKVPRCPVDKEKAIIDALKHFSMIER